MLLAISSRPSERRPCAPAGKPRRPLEHNRMHRSSPTKRKCGRDGRHGDRAVGAGSDLGTVPPHTNIAAPLHGPQGLRAEASRRQSCATASMPGLSSTYMLRCTARDARVCLCRCHIHTSETCLHICLCAYMPTGNFSMRGLQQHRQLTRAACRRRTLPRPAASPLAAI